MCVDQRGIHSVASQRVSEVHLGTNSILGFLLLFYLKMLRKLKQANSYQQERLFHKPPTLRGLSAADETMQKSNSGDACLRSRVWEGEECCLASQ